MMAVNPMVSSAVQGTSVASQLATLLPPAVSVPAANDPPKRELDPSELQRLGQKLAFLFEQYRSDRRIAELRWLRNQRQYLGLYDPEVEKELNANRSKAYPKLTRTKVISVVSRLMNLMFPGNERNWEIKADPSASMTKEDIIEAIATGRQADQDAGNQPDGGVDWMMRAIQTLADKRAEDLSHLIDDQLEELGGDQSYDYVALNRKVIMSAVLYGLGILEGPFVRTRDKTTWDMTSGVPTPKTSTVHMPMFEWVPVWDFYPDMSAKTFKEQDGYFKRKVMSRAQIRKLGKRKDFFEDVVVRYLTANQMGNYRPEPFETELRAMGVKVNVNEMKTETSKYQLIIWKGQTSGSFLSMAGIEIDADKMADDFDAEIWMIDGNVIKASINPWVELGVDVQTLHTFLYDEDDTSPIGQGLPNTIRDSQMMVSAATRMLMDNASVVCGPNLEVNTDLLRQDQDLSSTSAYKVWYRTGEGPDAQFPAVRNVEIESHLPDLQAIVKMGMDFADAETFVGPATGGDMDKMPSEPMRTASGASQLRGDSALPFKDVVRCFDMFTMSVILSCVYFNQKFNPDQAKEADFNVLARGATSLIAKEIRGAQIDQMVQTLTDGERLHVDERKLAEARFKVRDLGDLLVTEEVANQRKQAADQADQQKQQLDQQTAEALIRKTLSDAFKNVTQAQKNSALADAAAVSSALDLLQAGVENALNGTSPAAAQPNAAGGGQTNAPAQGDPGSAAPGAGDQPQAPGGNGSTGGMPPGQVSGASGGMPSVAQAPAGNQ
jgi:hypothetical protein